MINLVFDNETRTTDLERDGGNIIVSDLLDTAVLISLFTRRRALPTDEIPNPGGDLGGWWATPYEDTDGDEMGSRLWLLSRSVLTNANLNLAKAYIEEALAWMVEDGTAARVVVEVWRQNPDVLGFSVQIYKPDEVSTRWERVWTAHLQEL